MLTLRFSLTEEEYYQYNYYTAWSAPERKRYRILYFLRVIGLYGAVALLYVVASRSDLFWIDASVFLLTGLVYLVMIPFFVKRSVKRKVGDILSKKENQHVLDEAEIVVSANGIIDRDKVSESRYDWEAIVHLAETPDSYYLYTNSYHAVVIPKRAMSEEQQQELEKLVTANLPLHA